MADFAGAAPQIAIEFAAQKLSAPYPFRIFSPPLSARNIEREFRTSCSSLALAADKLVAPPLMRQFVGRDVIEKIEVIRFFSGAR